MMGIIFARIILSIVYEFLSIATFWRFQNQDSIAEVLLINLTEIVLVFTITRSLRWTLIKHAQYQQSQE